MRELKVAYNNSLRGILYLPKYNSASEIFVNLNILSFVSYYENLYIVLGVEFKTLVTR